VAPESHETKEQQFWAWFEQNEALLFGFEHDQERIFHELTMARADVSPDLSFEFGPLSNGTRDFVISAAGIRSAFAAVEALADAAPPLPRWNVIKFRPRRMPMMELTYASKTVKPEDVEFCLVSNGRELGIYLFFDGYSEDEAPIWGQIGYLLLDGALGEHDVEAKVGPIQFFPFDAHRDVARRPLPDLPAIFDARFAALKREL
jgi:hypothetical protein